MSKSTAAKKARRKRRLAARNERWLTDDMQATVAGVELIAKQINSRGWEFDREFSTDEFITWYYPPSGVDVDDESAEPVTRIWVTDPAEPHVLLVGTTPESDHVEYVLTVEQLFAHLATIEEYRLGDPQPTLS
ncbi:hypothetical protein [Mycolicibacterium arenosum]|uniref:Immunity protein Imm1 n=1 Tax=Mycolicibacterium arenosum TaxID=2952157 RepID=A0ABT1LYT8_9MYCO|nr:hypothetical protein [Mycolicibacterium sp. CAU 1645]MCP9272046.1 hypothetical protein [Mycolicibacterium sp. CAU 1645]